MDRLGHLCLPTVRLQVQELVTSTFIASQIAVIHWTGRFQLSSGEQREQHIIHQRDSVKSTPFRFFSQPMH